MNAEAGAVVPAQTPDADEVLRRIGRNLLLFQHIEHLLKALMSNSRLEGTLSSAQASHEERRLRIHKQTLGQLAGQFTEDILADAGERAGPEGINEAWFSFRFTIEADSVFVEQHRSEMKAVVDARNDLIHHFLPRWSPASEDSTRAALVYLDAQRAQALLIRDRLQGFANTFAEAAKAHAEFMSSPEGDRQFELMLLRHSRLVLLLGELATKTVRKDGWMDLATAGHVVRRLEPKELERMSELYGHRTLKKLLIATELFDLEDEPTPKGGKRTIFRIKPHYELQINPNGTELVAGQTT